LKNYNLCFTTVEFIRQRNQIIPVGLDSILKVCKTQTDGKETNQKPKFPIEIVRAVFTFIKPKIALYTNEDLKTAKKAQNVTILCDKMLEGKLLFKACDVNRVSIVYLYRFSSALEKLWCQNIKHSKDF
jgi:hypothetical protein